MRNNEQLIILGTNKEKPEASVDEVFDKFTMEIDGAFDALGLLKRNPQLQLDRSLLDAVIRQVGALREDVMNFELNMLNMQFYKDCLVRIDKAVNIILRLAENNDKFVLS